MKKQSVILRVCLVAAQALAAQALYAQPATPPPPPTDTSAAASTGSGLPKALRDLDDRAIPFLSKWSVCEPQVQKVVQQYFKTVGKEPGPDMAKIQITGEPKRNGRYEIYMLKCGNAIAIKKELEENMLQAVRDLLAQPVGDEGEEKYCHDFISQSAVGGKTSTDIQQKVGIGENNYRMPTGGRQYFSLSAFEQYLRVGATNWWLQNVIGNDPLGYMFWHTGEARILAKRPLIDNADNATRRVVPNLLKFHVGYGYRLTDNVDNTTGQLNALFPKRALNIGGEGRAVFGMEGVLPLGEDMKTSVIGASFNFEQPLSGGISETATIDAGTYSKIPLPANRRLNVVGTHPAGEVQLLDEGRTVTPVLRGSGQFTLFYSWWLEPAEGSENPPDNIFRVDVGLNYSEIQEAAIVRSTDPARPFSYLSRRALSGLASYRPESALDWIYAKFEYRNETTFPFGLSLQYSNQILMGDIYYPIFGNWLYLEAKIGKVMRDTRPYEAAVNRDGWYFMISPVFRVLIPR
jgi:hypothetical protein